MWVRIREVSFPVARADEVIAHVRNTAVSRNDGEGFRGFRLLIDRPNGRALEVSYWETEARRHDRKRCAPGSRRDRPAWRRRWSGATSTSSPSTAAEPETRSAPTTLPVLSGHRRILPGAVRSRRRLTLLVGQRVLDHLVGAPVTTESHHDHLPHRSRPGPERLLPRGGRPGQPEAAAARRLPVVVAPVPQPHPCARRTVPRRLTRLPRIRQHRHARPGHLGLHLRPPRRDRRRPADRDRVHRPDGHLHAGLRRPDRQPDHRRPPRLAAVAGHPERQLLRGGLHRGVGRHPSRPVGRPRARRPRRRSRRSCSPRRSRRSTRRATRT